MIISDVSRNDTLSFHILTFSEITTECRCLLDLLHEEIRIGIEGFNAVGAAELYLLAFINLGVGFLGLTEWAIDD